jgi:hypothetical protein
MAVWKPSLSAICWRVSRMNRSVPSGASSAAHGHPRRQLSAVGVDYPVELLGVGLLEQTEITMI